MNPLIKGDKNAIELFRKAFPETKFRKVYIKQFRGIMSLNSYWSSGYRDYFIILEIATGRTMASIPQNGTPFDGKNLELSALPLGFCLAVHHYAGCSQYGSLYFNEGDMVKMLGETAQPVNPLSHPPGQQDTNENI
jgi:hypothetical protein